MKILIVDDNYRLTDRMRQLLQKQYIVETVHSGDHALTLLSDSPFDLVILDLGLPDIPGLELCGHIRTISTQVPILIVTGVDTTASRVELLEAGADDYIAKPFEPPEFIARVQALLRRAERSEILSLIHIGDLTIDTASRTVTRNAQPIILRRKEFDILECLSRNRGRVMTRKMIIDHAWSSSTASWTGSVDVHIKQLRDKVDKPFAHPLIKTVYGVGYMIK